MARAGISGSKIGGIGRASLPVRLRAQANCGVFTAGRCTMVRWMSSPSCRISERRLSVKPRIADLAPQYTDCSGTER